MANRNYHKKMKKNIIKIKVLRGNDMKKWMSKFMRKKEEEKKKNRDVCYRNTKHQYMDIFNEVEKAVNNEIIPSTSGAFEYKATYKELTFVLKRDENYYCYLYGDKKRATHTLQVLDEETEELLAFGGASGLYFIPKVVEFLTDKRYDDESFYLLYPHSPISEYILEAIEELKIKNRQKEEEEIHRQEEERMREIREQERKMRYLEEKYQNKRNQA